MRRLNNRCLVLGVVLLAVFIFLRINYDIEPWIANIFIIPIGFLFFKGFNRGNSTLSSELIILTSFTLGLVVASLLARNVSVNEILIRSFAAIVSAGVVAIILYFRR
ncbi:hypothetical protein [Proteiniphilum sp.]|uniref:hypothetical protein n=1 Tax=Proteiniphilum sp. TaxID=1926877 RepID=UPI0009297F13|nr:hypothetical protein [Proteiniphilum sp.]MEA5127948.1 hypothetical protein [Proteiniphilum sp.]OJV81625.1 MAG: hypothetical protein BGO34_09415 [Bacteroidia bacterium 44-10]